MIILVHDTKQVISCQKDGAVLSNYHHKPLVKSFLDLSAVYPDELLIWVFQDYQQAVNYKTLKEIFHHKRIMASYSSAQYLPEAIGYVEQGPFINVNLNVKYPTWRMHQDVGGMYTSVINAYNTDLPQTKDLNALLHHLAKFAQPQGLLCYSNPDLLKPKTLQSSIPTQQTSLSQLFKFVSIHYKWVWKHLLILNLFIYDSKIPFLAWLKSCFISQKKITNNPLEAIPLPKLEPIKANDVDLDVIIPTIGRKAYLYDVLKDLSKQSILPKRVIIVEQNPNPNANSELDYLKNESWPFKIIHKFTHQTGACQARNKALDLVKAKWVFLADDDIKIRKKYIENSLSILDNFKIEALVTECIMKNEASQNFQLKSWSTFGSGTSFVNKNILKETKFNIALEHGYGEDVDFGLQIRNIGYDVLFSSITSLIHLKAPVGGFRTKPSLPWENSKPLPKPSPTVLLSKILSFTPQQLLGYKSILFFKTLKTKGYIHIIGHLEYFKKAWANSEYWAKELNKKA